MATMGGVSFRMPPTQAPPTPEASPLSLSLPSKSDSNSHGISVLLRTGSWNSADASSQQSSRTLKRKAGSPNLSAAHASQRSSHFDPFHAPAAATPNTNEGLHGASPFVRSDPRPSNIHSFAFDFNRYLDPLPDASSTAGPCSKPVQVQPAVNDPTTPPQTNPRIHPPKAQGYPTRQNLSQYIERSARPTFRSSRNNTRSVPAGSILSDASTPSLSRFPLPPTSNNPTDPNSSEGRDEPGTPTVYHFRGASFEFVNPRNSLRLQNIETPAEHDADAASYFQLSLKGTERPQKARSLFMAAPAPINDMENSHSRATPPRSLFDDLPSAYNSIRKNQKTPSPMLDLPLPPSPMPSRGPSRPSHEQFSSTENLLERGYQSQAQRQSPASSFRKRFSQVFRLKGRDANGSERNEGSRVASAQSTLDDDAVVYQQRPTCEQSFKAGRESVDECEAVKVGDDGHLFHFQRKPNRHYYHDTSILDQTTAGSRSTSFLHESRYRGKAESSYSTGTGENESTEDLIASYGYEVDDSARSSAPSNLLRHRSMPLFQGRPSAQAINKQADSTIGEILEQYHHQEEPSEAQGYPVKHPVHRRASMPAIDPHMTRHTTGDLRDFDFGLAQQGEISQDNIDLETLPDDRIRAATARALSTHATAAPLGPLPADPSDRLGSFSASRQYSGNSSSLSATSYGDTRHLLLLSQSSIEFGLGTAANYLEPNEQTFGLQSSSGLEPSEERLSPMAHPTRRVSPINNEGQRTSARSYEDVVNRDLKYLSRLSGLSNFQGSVYMVGSASSVQASDNERNKNPKHPSTTTRTSGRSHQLETQKPVEATWLPIAAFQQSSVVPGICRLPAADREAFGRDQEAAKSIDDDGMASEQGELDLSDDEATEDAFDWETLPDSRLAHESQRTNDSFAEWSSYSSLNTFRNVNVHPGDSRLQHGYRLHSPENTDGPVLVPAYEFRGSSGFPNRNALTPPTPALYNTYKHPVPLSQTHENPFTSSPPQITGSVATKAHLFSAKSGTVGISSTTKDENLPVFSIRHNNRSLVPEETGDTPRSKSSTGRSNGVSNRSKPANGFKILSRESSGWLSSEPGPEISLEAKHGSPCDFEKQKQQPRSTRLSSGVDPGLVHVLRQGDSRMASSPLSPANSFAKLSRLGPMGNITGTPNGTGMREVGSSLIGSSSPAAIPDSSPPVAYYHTPITEPSTNRRSQRSIPLFQASSPLAKFDEFQYGFGDQLTTNKHRRGASFRDALIADGYAERQGRRAVPGQKELIEMTLHPNDRNGTTNRRSDTQNLSKQIPERKSKQLLPPPVTNTSLPKLRHRYRSPSSHTSGTRQRKQHISWVCFVLCAIFPFTLILYGHGVLDAVMVYWTEGDIRHFGRRQKKVAKIFGWGTAATTILTVVILFAVIRTVPNDYPR